MRQLLSIILTLLLPIPQGVGGKAGMGGKAGLGGGSNTSTSTTSRIFNGSSDFLNSAATLDLTAYNQLSGSYDINWTTNANNDTLLGEFSASYGSCSSSTRCFIINPNDSASTVYAINLHSASGFMTCTFPRPSADTNRRRDSYYYRRNLRQSNFVSYEPRRSQLIWSWNTKPLRPLRWTYPDQHRGPKLDICKRLYKSNNDYW